MGNVDHHVWVGEHGHMTAIDFAVTRTERDFVLIRKREAQTGPSEMNWSEELKHWLRMGIEISANRVACD